MADGKLTAVIVDRAHRRGLPIVLNDGHGLYLRKQTRDGAFWTLRYTFAGRERWITLRHYPDVTLAQARVDARATRVQLERQQDPLTLRRSAQEELRQQISFAQLCEDWFKSEIDRRPLKHKAVPRHYLDKYLLPTFGRRTAKEITASQVARLLDGDS